MVGLFLLQWKNRARLPPLWIERLNKVRAAGRRRAEAAKTAPSEALFALGRVRLLKCFFSGRISRLARRVLGCPGVYTDEKDNRAIGSNLPGCFCADRGGGGGSRGGGHPRGGWRWTHSRSRSCSREGFQACARFAPARSQQAAATENHVAVDKKGHPDVPHVDAKNDQMGRT